MNRDQWHRKMRREIELFSYAGTTPEEVAEKKAAEKGMEKGGQQVPAVEQERASDSRLAESEKAESVVSPTEKYSACCEWDLAIKPKER